MIKTAKRERVHLYCLGNGIEPAYDKISFSALETMLEAVKQISGSVMLRGNHDNENEIWAIEKVPVFNFRALPIFYSENGVLFTHNIDTMINLDRKLPQRGVDVSAAGELTNILLRECGVYRENGGYYRYDSLGKTRVELSKKCNGLVKSSESKAYLEAVCSMMDKNGERMAFVGHEHNIDRDATIVFELGTEYQWSIVEAGSEKALSKDRKSIVVAPHFWGITKGRFPGPEGRHSIHYIEFTPEIKRVRYVKFHY